MSVIVLMLRYYFYAKKLVTYETSRSVQKSCTFFKIFGSLALSSKSLRLPLLAQNTVFAVALFSKSLSFMFFTQNLCNSRALLKIFALLALFYKIFALLVLFSISMHFLRFAQTLYYSCALLKIFALLALSLKSSCLLHFPQKSCALLEISRNCLFK